MYLFCFYSRSHNRKKRLLASSMSVRLSACVPAYMSVCPSVRTYQRGSHWTDFGEIWYGDFLWKSVQKFQIWLKSGKNVGTVLEDVSMFYGCRRHKFAIESSLYNTQCCFIVDSDMYFNNTHSALLLFHGNSGYTNAPQCYVIRTLRVLLRLRFSGVWRRVVEVLKM
jgi:hypothetical protein